MATTSFRHAFHADELRIRPSNDSDLRVPVGGSLDWFEPLLVAFAVLTVLTLLIWFRAGLYGLPIAP